MTIQRARVILGKKAEKSTDAEISEIISFLDILVEVTTNTMKKDSLNLRLKSKLLQP
jgi:hypothetical protein